MHSSKVRQEPIDVAVVGIDPGLTGAIALTNKDGCVGLWDIPVEATTGFIKHRVNVNALSEIIDDILTMYPRALFVLERVASRPAQGVASVFSIGDTVGCIRGILAAYGVSPTVVEPAKWKQGLGLGKEKEESMDMAKSVFPGLESKLSRKRDHNRAEALMIAYWKSTELGITNG